MRRSVENGIAEESIAFRRNAPLMVLWLHRYGVQNDNSMIAFSTKRCNPADYNTKFH
jgi:hypothetical protein